MPNFKKNTSTFKMYGKSPMAKKLVGKQGNLPAELKAKIMAAPESPAKMYGKKSPAKKYKSDAQRKAVHASKAEKASPGKMYGKSPMKEEMTTKQKEDSGTQTNRRKDLTTLATTKQKKKKLSYADAYKKRDKDLYGGLSLSEFTTEAKRQKSGGKVPKKPMSSTPPPPKPPKVGTVNTTEGVLKGDKGNFADNKGLTDFSKPKTKAKSRRELANERIAARRAKRNAKLKKFVRGFRGASKA